LQITRKLEAVREHLELLAEQGEVEGFFSNLENAGKLGKLVWDIRDAMIEYQVGLDDTHILQHL
jgi:hypothetical protein